LGLIGTAELDRDLQKTVVTILRDKDVIAMNKEQDLNLDAEELRKHLDLVKRSKKQTQHE
jgi:hypothetical protein